MKVSSAALDGTLVRLTSRSAGADPSLSTSPSAKRGRGLRLPPKCEKCQPKSSGNKRRSRDPPPRDGSLNAPKPHRHRWPELPDLPRSMASKDAAVRSRLAD